MVCSVKSRCSWPNPATLILSNIFLLFWQITQAAALLPTKPKANWNSCISLNLASLELGVLPQTQRRTGSGHSCWVKTLSPVATDQLTAILPLQSRETLSSMKNWQIVFNHNDHHRKRWPEISVLFWKQRIWGRESIVKSSLDQNTFVAFFSVPQKDNAVADVFSGSLQCWEAQSEHFAQMWDLESLWA